MEQSSLFDFQLTVHVMERRDKKLQVRRAQRRSRKKPYSLKTFTKATILRVQNPLHAEELSFAVNVVAMAIVVDVTLISVQRVSLEADLTASAKCLAERARQSLGVGRGRLFSSSGSMLDGDTKLGEAGLQTGDCLTLQTTRNQLKNVQQIQASSNAFAAILGDGSVVTWGPAACGGDSSSAQDQLKNVRRSQPLMRLLQPSCVMGL